MSWTPTAAADPVLVLQEFAWDTSNKQQVSYSMLCTSDLKSAGNTWESCPGYAFELLSNGGMQGIFKELKASYTGQADVAILTNDHANTMCATIKKPIYHADIATKITKALTVAGDDGSRAKAGETLEKFWSRRTANVLQKCLSAPAYASDLIRRVETADPAFEGDADVVNAWNAYVSNDFHLNPGLKLSAADKAIVDVYTNVDGGSAVAGVSRAVQLIRDILVSNDDTIPDNPLHAGTENVLKCNAEAVHAETPKSPQNEMLSAIISQFYKNGNTHKLTFAQLKVAISQNLPWNITSVPAPAASVTAAPDAIDLQYRVVLHLLDGVYKSSLPSNTDFTIAKVWREASSTTAAIVTLLDGGLATPAQQDSVYTTTKTANPPTSELFTRNWTVMSPVQDVQVWEAYKAWTDKVHYREVYQEYARHQKGSAVPARLILRGCRWLRHYNNVEFPVGANSATGVPMQTYQVVSPALESAPLTLIAKKNTGDIDESRASRFAVLAALAGKIRKTATTPPGETAAAYRTLYEGGAKFDLALRGEALTQAWVDLADSLGVAVGDRDSIMKDNHITVQPAGPEHAAGDVATKAAQDAAADKAAQDAAAALAASAAQGAAGATTPAIFDKNTEWTCPSFVPTAQQCKALQKFESDHTSMVFMQPDQLGSGYSTHYVIDAILKAVAEDNAAFTGAMRQLVADKMPTREEIEEKHTRLTVIGAGPVLLYADACDHALPLRPQQNKHARPRLMVEYMARMAGLTPKSAGAPVAASMVDPRRARAAHTSAAPRGKATPPLRPSARGRAVARVPRLPEAHAQPPLPETRAVQRITPPPAAHARAPPRTDVYMYICIYIYIYIYIYVYIYIYIYISTLGAFQILAA